MFTSRRNPSHGVLDNLVTMVKNNPTPNQRKIKTILHLFLTLPFNTRFYVSKQVAKGEGLVLAKKLSNSLSNLKGYIYKIHKIFT